MHFKLVVPPGSKGGDLARIHVCDGTQANVTIPSGLESGNSFVVALSAAQLKNPAAVFKEQEAQAQEQSKQQSQTRENLPVVEDVEVIGARKIQQQLQDGVPLIPAIAMADGYNDNNFEQEQQQEPNNEQNENVNNNNSPIAALDPKAEKALHQQLVQLQELQEKTRKLYRMRGNMERFFGLFFLVQFCVLIGFGIGILHSTETIYAMYPIHKKKSKQKRSKSGKVSITMVPSGTPATTKLLGPTSTLSSSTVSKASSDTSTTESTTTSSSTLATTTTIPNDNDNIQKKSPQHPRRPQPKIENLKITVTALGGGTIKVGE